jgi:hypothetical protein
MPNSEEVKGQIYIGGQPLREAFFFKYLIGKYFFIYVWVLPFVIFYAIPWEFLYHQAWYQSYISIVSNILPVLTNIQDSKIEFMEYATAFLAFIDTLGLALLFFVFIYGFYSIKISNNHSLLRASLKVFLFNAILIFSFGGVLFPYFILAWDGSVPRQFPEIIVLRKDVFLVVAILMWWITILVAFAVPAYFKIILTRLKISN